MARPNLVDRLVGYFNPGRGVTRLRDRTALSAMTGGYRGGKRGRRATQNWLPEGGSADADLLPDLSDLRARSRDLARNMPVVAGAIATKKTHVIGDGLSLNAQVRRDVLDLSEEQAGAKNREIEAEWALFCKEADYTLVQQMADLEFMLYGGVKESGDIFVLRRYRRDYAGQPYMLKLQVVEADRVSNPNFRADTETLVAGIEHNPEGLPTAVHISDRHPGDIMRKAMSWRRVPMRYRDGRAIVLHLFERLRPGQTRGIPLPAAVIEELKSLGDYTDAEVRAAVTSAMFTAFITTPAGDGGEGPLPSTGEGSDGKPNIEMGSGAIVDLAAGEEVTFANPNRPNPQFEAFVTAFMRQIGVALELPYELLIKHFTASYSASRAALEIAYHSFRRERNWFVRVFMQPVYGWFMEEAVLRGRLDLPGFFDDPRMREAWLNATWTGPVRISLDPKKESDADKQDVEMAFKTRQQVMTERTGGDFDQKVERAKREKAAVDDAGLSPPARSTAATAPAEEREEEDA